MEQLATFVFSLGYWKWVGFIATLLVVAAIFGYKPKVLAGWKSLVESLKVWK